jgi:signal peptidase I
VGVFKSVISFPLFMILILLLTGIIWLIDHWFFEKKRAADKPDPTVVDYAKSFFPVILLVFVLRSFLVEPFKIPSGSMMPTLLAGDYILVNKFTYGLRVPVLNNTFIEINKPKRGDVIVFHYPPDPKIDYIKRVIGLPGDTIAYQDKRLTVNGKPLATVFKDDNEYLVKQANLDGSEQTLKFTAHRYNEQIDEITHDIFTLDSENNYAEDAPGAIMQSGGVVTVPEGHYFAMGDNRDNSADGRVWGFVPEKNLVGKAFFIWFNFDQFGRIGDKIQ